MSLVDLAAGSEVEVARPCGRKWHHNSSVSPDRRLLAAGIDVSPFRTEAEWVKEIVATGGKYGGQPSKLALIDCATGFVTVAEGEFDNFNSPPVWTPDSKALVFSAPFQPRGLWMCRVDEPKLERIKFKTNAPVPLCDASDLIT
jgi:hypothetical protein